mgnify:CR=1 FL=1
MPIVVRVPASTTNLGPGFDALGLALALHNRIEIDFAETPTVTVVGEGAGRLPADPSNLAYRVAADLCEAAGRPRPTLALRLHNAVPVRRGLGSSSTAIVGALVAANALLGEPFSREELLRRAVAIEGHPDNVTPTLLGGFQVVTMIGDRPVHVRLPFPPELTAVVAIPDREIETEHARAVLPPTVPSDDAVFNVGRVALLLAALAARRWEWLGAAMEDRLHQPYRAPLLPGFAEAIAAARAAGADGACLSGSGSALLALTRREPAAVGEAMVAALARAGTRATWRALPCDEEGAVVESA